MVVSEQVDVPKALVSVSVLRLSCRYGSPLVRTPSLTVSARCPCAPSVSRSVVLRSSLNGGTRSLTPIVCRASYGPPEEPLRNRDLDALALRIRQAVPSLQTVAVSLFAHRTPKHFYGPWRRCIAGGRCSGINSLKYASRLSMLDPVKVMKSAPCAVLWVASMMPTRHMRFLA